MNPQQIARALRQHLKTDQMLGIDAVPYLTDIDLQAVQNVSSIREARPAPSPTKVTSTTKRSATAAAEASALPTDFHDFQLPSDIPEQPEKRQHMLEVINDHEVRDCTRCRLCESRTQTVFGSGSTTASLMFIGEGPGREEDIQGMPFVGRSGELLDRQIAAIGDYAGWKGFSREDVYIANVVKCRPPQNRTPSPDEAAACWTYLARQIAIVQPKVIITLGGPAAKRLLNTEIGITRLRGTWHSITLGDREIPVMPTFHPAYVLRSYTRDNRMNVWKDLQAATDKLKEAS